MGGCILTHKATKSLLYVFASLQLWDNYWCQMTGYHAQGFGQTFTSV